MLELSKQYDLSGFCLPGKPGIICIEGLEYNVESWWYEVSNSLAFGPKIFEL